MPNTDNINKLIEALRADQENGTHFVMSDFAFYLDDRKVKSEDDGKYHHCNTAFCLAGWANHLRMIEAEPEMLLTTDYLNEASSEKQAAEWLGISLGQSGFTDLFHMHNSERIGMTFFDETLPKELRYASGIRVLEILRDEGVTNWQRAFDETGAQAFYNDWIRKRYS